MDRKVTKTLLLVLVLVISSNANPLEKRAIDDSPTASSSTSVEPPSSSSSHPVQHPVEDPVERHVEDIVIHAHEDDEIVSAKDGTPERQVFERQVDEYLVEPVGQEYLLVPVDDMDVAASGLVFRPLFRYRQQSRRRVDRNTRRRYAQPRPYYRYY